VPTPTPEELVERFAAAWSAGDAPAIGALFADDADFVNVVGLWWRRRADIEQAHAYGFERIFAGSTMRLLETRVRRMSADVAVVHGRWELAGQRGPEGSPGGRRRGVLVLVARRTPAGWEAVTAQNTDRLPGSETVLVRDGRAAAVSYRRPETGAGEPPPAPPARGRR
jgi:uncharacterized protein (TIGR02246 family)